MTQLLRRFSSNAVNDNSTSSNSGDGHISASFLEDVSKNSSGTTRYEQLEKRQR
ncbi:7074_t:CDS:2 [Ambispora gerdemannii]|uniref:7074_t:CDS:1 n=1 Tax=Ambispora gerdemannii TaxID=144530 RepID=A0A9N9A3H3_9GLOM|nr:7074_t:CDS:2 [Ambispora gerdemannii]